MFSKAPFPVYGFSGLVWTVGLTVEIKLCFFISPTYQQVVNAGISMNRIAKGFSMCNCNGFTLADKWEELKSIFRPYYVLFNVRIDGIKLTRCLNTAGHKGSLSESSQCSFSHANRFLAFLRLKTSPGFVR